ncbi:TMF-regulated nuclear protein 1 [Gopherus evgoodei]|uniref:TMF-regulated nuclear protein 1 n=1 Tax=Gopherus evgoodei TaxID=1825980 RepID=UPI0011CF1BCC|nr:TMF-regulated nuclear protein 1 [Gopherus evgoodei]
MPGGSAAAPPGQDPEPLAGSAGAGKPRPRAEEAAGGSALELAEARRRLLEVEARRRLVLELESRVQQLHRVLVQAELRMAGRAESLARLGSGAGQAQIHLAAHGQRLKKSLRRSRKARQPALLASALGGCVPWAAGKLRRGRAGAPEPPESPFKRSLPGGTPCPGGGTLS